MAQRSFYISIPDKLITVKETMLNLQFKKPMSDRYCQQQMACFFTGKDQVVCGQINSLDCPANQPVTKYLFTMEIIETYSQGQSV